MVHIRIWLHKKWMGLKYRMGWAQRGRTASKSSVHFEGVAKFHSRLTTRKMVLTPEGKAEYNRLIRADAPFEVLREFLETAERVEDESGRREVLDRVVTTAGVNYMVDAFQNLVEIENFKYHDSGTGVVAEAVGDTGLGTPTGIARAVGSQTEGASANIYKTVGTITYDGAYAITEHGIFSASAAGTLWDRTVFSAINVANTDQIEFTYELTCTAGG